jgi:broad specificity phosphatase PhoE
MRVHLVRHAQSAGNVMDLRAHMTVADFNQLLRQSPDLPLTEEGVRQAERLAERLAGICVERLYCSPFERARRTAQIYGAAIGLQPVIIPELHEVVPDVLSEHRGDTSLRRHYVRSFARMAWSQGGPSWRAEYRRAKAAWAHVIAASAAEIVAVSHAWTITLILLSLRRDPHWRLLSRDLSNTGISTVVRVEGL